MLERDSLTQKFDFTKSPLVKVTWLDAYVDYNEMEATEVTDDLKICRDHGVLLKRTRKAVVLAQSTFEDDGLVRYVTTIPMSLVLRIEKFVIPEVIYEKRKPENAKTAKKPKKKRPGGY